MRLSMIKICLLCLFCSLLLGSLSACREDTRVEHVHELVDVAAVAPTCDTVGKTQGEKCTLCGQMTVIPQSIPATGHVYSDEWTTDIAPTADAPGERSRHCTVCDVRIAITEIPRLAPYTQGLSFALNEDKNGYVCTGVGTASDLSLLHIPASYEGLPVTHIGYEQGYCEAHVEYGDWHHPTHRPDEYIPTRYEAKAAPIALPASVKRVVLHRHVALFSRVDTAEGERKLVYEIHPENQTFALRPDGSLVLKCFL